MVDQGNLEKLDSNLTNSKSEKEEIQDFRKRNIVDWMPACFAERPVIKMRVLIWGHMPLSPALGG